MTHWHVEGLEADLDHFHLGPVNLDLAPGKAVAVLGPSGAGKTTLLRTLAGFLPTRRGRIARDGVDIAEWPPESRGLGYVPQGLGLFPHRTVERNVRFPLEMHERPDATVRTRELLERFHLTELARRYPRRLSGGEQQRVAIARAMAADPDLLVWDEPWQALDVTARYELGLVLHDLRVAEKVPVVVVTHDPGLAFSVADTFLVLRSGRVRGQYTAPELLTHPPDAFLARFVGFDNVLERPALDADGSELGRWLRARAGPEGIAFPAPPPGPVSGEGTTWEGRLRRARPDPTGLVLEVTAGELMLTLRRPPPWSTPWPQVGDVVRFRLAEATLQPLGGTPRGPGAAG